MIKALDDWMENNSVSLHRWESILNEFKVDAIGYRYWRESDNPAYRLFMA